jgi:hypothetical protein
MGRSDKTAMELIFYCFIFNNLLIKLAFNKLTFYNIHKPPSHENLYSTQTSNTKDCFTLLVSSIRSAGRQHQRYFISIYGSIIKYITVILSL